jgi:iron complex outermembrane receptor protein
MPVETRTATTLAAILLTCSGLGATLPAVAEAQQVSGQSTTALTVAVSADQPLEEVIITGSLIPTSAGEATAVPRTSITADDLENKGYRSLADALQQQVYATGGAVGAAGVPNGNVFTPAARTMSMFGLPPGFVKYLIDGRPMSDYPALYGGTDVITDIGGIPEDLVDHIDILPGGQSSLYGSDAIAGLVNIVMRKNLDEPIVRARLGGYQHGGGTDRRISAAAGHTFGVVNIMGGVEYEKIDPIWGYQRELTKQRYPDGRNPAVAALDWVVSGSSGFYFLDPSNCANVASQFGGSVAKQTRPAGQSCGTLNAGYNTISNDTESTQGYLHANADISAMLQLYADALIAHGSDKFSPGTGFWTTDDLPDGVYYDPNLDDYVGLQHIFSPEELGGLRNSLNTADTDSWRATLGARGDLGQSRWTYDLGFSYTEQKLTEGTHQLLAGPADSYYEAILGPDLGLDPYGGGYSTRTPDYAKFYMPIPQSQYAGMSTVASSSSRTEDSMIRGQLTNTALFKLPGSPAGIALAAEAGHQDWRYTPDPGYFNGQLWQTSAVAGSGGRSRYAVTGELRLPVEKWLTITGSSRYDSYHADGNDISSNTYNVAVELRPVRTWLLRGHVGTAFKAPTLADQFQGLSRGLVFVPDYYQCALQGKDYSDCKVIGVSRSTSGNTDLQPIKASVSGIGTVWAPTGRASISLDYLHWNISNEVAVALEDQITLTESECRLGNLDINSPTCVAALGYVTRDSAGNIVSMYSPKVNVASEVINAFVAEGRYGMSLGKYGDLEVRAAWNDMLTHTLQFYPGEPRHDLLTEYQWSGEFKSKINASVTWSTHKWRSTIYVDRYGASPNLAATLAPTFPQSKNFRALSGTLHPWIVTNLTTRYQWSRRLELALSVQNLFDVMPPPDHTWGGNSESPYFDFKYNVYGMSYYAQLSYQFGN